MVICVSKKYDVFFQVRPLKIYRKKPAIELEYKLDYDLYVSLSLDEKQKYVVREYMNTIEAISKMRRIKNFDFLHLNKDVHRLLERQYNIGGNQC